MKISRLNALVWTLNPAALYKHLLYPTCIALRLEHSGGFRHVQHVRRTRAPQKGAPTRGAAHFFAGNNGRHPSERATVMTKKGCHVFQEKINRGAELTADER